MGKFLTHFFQPYPYNFLIYFFLKTYPYKVIKRNILKTYIHPEGNYMSGRYTSLCQIHRLTICQTAVYFAYSTAAFKFEISSLQNWFLFLWDRICSKLLLFSEMLCLTNHPFLERFEKFLLPTESWDTQDDGQPIGSLKLCINSIDMSYESTLHYNFLRPETLS